ncbi:hypothetical protein VTH06DRAFT_6783 [Thermothelomyces fergusii]
MGICGVKEVQCVNTRIQLQPVLTGSWDMMEKEKEHVMWTELDTPHWDQWAKWHTEHSAFLPPTAHSCPTDGKTRVREIRHKENVSIPTSQSRALWLTLA